MSDILFKDWLALDDKQRLEIQEGWNTNGGQAEGIANEVYKLFLQQYSGIENMTITSPGIYHGGDWVIGVVLRVGHAIELPDRYLGIKIQKTFWGLTKDLKDKLKNVYGNDVSKFIDGEVEVFSNYFKFVKPPLNDASRKILTDFVNEVPPEPKRVDTKGV